jgi:hypothetical protein
LQAYQGSVKRYRSSISGLKKRLADTTEACDAIREIQSPVQEFLPGVAMRSSYIWARSLSVEFTVIER